jgi:hypothetical protein
MMYGHEKSDPAIVAGKATTDEQSAVIRRGVGGAKARDRGECGPTQHAPDSASDKRDTARWLAYGKLLPSMSEVGAGCGKAARPDLGGGRVVTRVPTANARYCSA